MNREAVSVNLLDVENWIALLPSIINAYAPRDVYNADELGLFFRVQPSKSLSMKGESCHSGKISKDRVMVLLCCNEDGSTVMKPWVIGRTTNSTCLRNIARLPCIYNNNRKAWIFEQLLRYLDG